MKRIRALCISRNFPNAEFPRLGIWVSRLVAASSDWCETKVIAPVPFAPPFLHKKYSRYREIASRETSGDVEIFHPRMFQLPGMRLHSLEGESYYRAVRRLVGSVRTRWPFDLIHAHFVYPDGAVASRLSQDFGVPFLMTEHASWIPWLNDYPLVRKTALAAARRASRIIAVSQSLSRSIASFGIPEERISVIPNVVDGSVFESQGAHRSVAPSRVLFVGIVRKVKGIDVLLRAIRLLVDDGVRIRLTIAGESFYASYARDYAELTELCTRLGLDDDVQFVGAMNPMQVAAEMRDSSVVVLPSWRETFGVVLAEALACGTPVVATRCGGPEDIVDDQSGLLVNPGDPAALAAALKSILSNPAYYDPNRLRQHALDRFGRDVVSNQLRSLYEQILT